MSKSFKQFMAETRVIDRWFVLKVALGGAFFGAILTLGFSFVALFT